MATKNKTVVVTGGCGYIGSHVARAFKQKGNRVYVIDRVQRDHALNGMDGYYIGDFASLDSLATIRELAPDIIVHCAGTSLVGPSMTDPAEYYNNNVVKTITMLNSIKQLHKPPMVLFSSSASVYGEPEHVPVVECHRLDPISPYGNTKLAVERILNDYYTAYNLNSVCFRFFNAAGAEPHNFDLGQEPEATHIVARVLEASINKRAFTINGEDFATPDGTCVRDYIHVWDLAHAHLCAVDFVDQEPGAHIFNLGTNHGTSNRRILDYVKDTYGMSTVFFGEARPGDPATLVADATLANEVLGWVPEHSDIKTIIDTAYKWYTRK
jgi:UDP-glucose 4-epimerase